MTEPQRDPKPHLHVVSEGIGKERDIYTHRFSPQEERTREKIWQVLTEDFLQRYVPADGTVLDIGAGDSLFLKNIVAKRRIAVDLSDHVQALTNFGIEVLQVPATELKNHLQGAVDTVFMSNFLEHLPNKSLVLEILAVCREVLKPTGRVMILQPNIRYVGSAYWDYIDHHIALTEHSLAEALEVSGYEVERIIPRFLPYTAKSRLGRTIQGMNVEKVMRFYLNTPILWRIFGAQTFVVARPRA